MRSLLKWPGGKRWLAPQLRKSYIESGSPRLVEPFAGSLAIALGFRPDRAVLNDANPHVINLYAQIKTGALVQVNLSSINEENEYYARRKEFNLLIKKGQHLSPRAAELFYYLNRCGFNGLCRFNTAGEFNVPFGDMKITETDRDFSHFRILFKTWDFICGDFSNLSLEDSDYLYLDPPYDAAFTDYSAGGFSWEDQERLGVWANSHKGPVVLSNSNTESIRQLYSSLGFSISTLVAPRSISQSSTGRGQVSEILAYKNIDISVERFESNILFD